MAVIGLDIGNKYGFMSVLDPGLTSPEPLVDEKYRSGVPTDAMVHPNGFIRVDAGLSVDKLPSTPARRMLIGSVKNMLDTESISCENSSGEQFEVKTADVFAAIVRELVCHANQERKKLHQDPIYDVMVAIPAKFCDGDQSNRIMEKIRSCVESIVFDDHRVRLIGTIPEPAAAAIDYLHFRQFEIAEEKRIKGDQFTVVVYDLGHGTFDTALVQVNTKDGTYHLHHQDGLPYGGKNMDQAILDYFANQVAIAAGNDAMNLVYRGKYKEKCLRLAQDAKERLSEENDFEEEIVLQDRVLLTLSRAQFEELIEYDIENTIKQLQIMFDHAKDIGIPVNMIVMTGGCSNVPLVKEKVEAFAQEKGVPCGLYRPHRAVSFGAARHAATAEITNHTAYRYSLLLDNGGRQLMNIISKRQTLPYSTNVLSLTNQYDGFWIVRSLDENDPADENSLESFNRLMHFKVDIPIGTEFKAQITLGNDYLFKVNLSPTGL